MRLPELRKWLRRGHRGGAHATLAPPADALMVDQSPVAARPQGAEPLPPWTVQRLEIAESLWGPGSHLPGASDEVIRIAVPLGLSAATSLLLVGAGCGGSTVRLAGELGVWVCACEADAVLAAAAAQRVQRAGGGLSKRATIQTWDPAAPNFRPASFHHAIAMEAFHAGDPQRTIAAIAAALRPGGQLAVLETVAGARLNLADPALQAWCRLEQRDPPRPGTAWLTEPLERLGFDIRVSEDISARHMRQAVAGWKQLLRPLSAERPTPARAAILVKEAELWLRRIQLLRSGQLKLMRWHAMGAAGAVRKVAA